MLRYEVTLKNGEKRSNLRAVSAEWKSELDVPADSLTLNCVYDGEIFENADRITAYNRNELVFDGQLDEIIRIRRDSGIALKLCARSAAAALLDNEAEPLSYRNPSVALMLKKHLQPFGITDVEPDGVPIIGDMRIDKGMTHWQVLEMFCKTKYRSKLRISGGGKVFLRGFKNDKKVKFGSGGIEYYSIKENKSRCKLISEVKLKVSDTGGYLSSLKNPNAECGFVKRVRYVNAAADDNSLNTADVMIEQSNLDSHYIKLTFGGCVTDILGAEAELDDAVFGRMNGLTVRKLIYSLSPSGELTTVYLGKEKY